MLGPSKQSPTPSQIHPSWDWMNAMGYVPLSNPSSKDLGTFLLALAWHIWWHKESHNKNQKAKRNSKDAMLKVYLALEKKWVGLLSCHKRLRKIFRLSFNKKTWQLWPHITQRSCCFWILSAVLCHWASPSSPPATKRSFWAWNSMPSNDNHGPWNPM